MSPQARPGPSARGHRRRGRPRSRVVVITGAAHGIGHRLAHDLLARGSDRLTLCDVDAVALQRAFGATSARTLALDVTDFGQWQHVVSRVVTEDGRLDVLCNIAGVLTPTWLHESDVATIDHHIDVNVKGVLYGSRVATGVMVDQRHGHIVNMASQAGIGFTPGNTLYAASKHAVRGFTISLAAELRTHGVAVSCVCPGIVDTRMLDAQIDRREGAASFLSGRPLSVAEVSIELQRVMDRRPVESAVPNAALARLAALRPAIAVRLADVLMARGGRAAARLRNQRAADTGAHRAPEPVDSGADSDDAGADPRPRQDR